jgi:hypothetical protein
MLRQLGRLRKSQSLINPIGNRDGLEKRSERCGSWSDAAKTSRWMLVKLKVTKEEKRREEKKRRESGSWAENGATARMDFVSLHKNAMNLLKLVRKGELAILNYGMVL